MPVLGLLRYSGLALIILLPRVSPAIVSVHPHLRERAGWIDRWIKLTEIRLIGFNIICVRFSKTVMLAGDIQKVADYVARDLGVDEVHAELLPADKVTRVEELLCLLLLTALRCTSALDANGDVASAVEETWKEAVKQIKSVVETVVFPAPKYIWNIIGI